jgi:DNA-binding transcriptional ArsR family regulator
MTGMPGSATLDDTFRALSDPTRRELLDRLTEGPASMGYLARSLPITLTAVMQHVQVLEAGGLVQTHKQGRVRTCTLAASGLRSAEQWLADRRALWERRLDRLGAVLDEQAAQNAPRQQRHDGSAE